MKAVQRFFDAARLPFITTKSFNKIKQYEKIIDVCNGLYLYFGNRRSTNDKRKQKPFEE